MQGSNRLLPRDHVVVGARSPLGPVERSDAEAGPHFAVRPANDVQSLTDSEHRILASRGEFQIVQYQGRYYGIPKALGAVYLKDARYHEHSTILRSDDPQEIVRKIDACDPRIYLPTFVENWGAYRVYSLANEYFAAPPGIEDDLVLRASIEREPAMLIAPSLAQIRERIEQTEARFPLEVVGTYRKYQIVRYGARTYGLPPQLAALDLRMPASRECPGVLAGDTAADVQQRIDLAIDVVDVEYAGWLPALKPFGNCGTHPQFSHVDEPPEGYRFIRSDRPLIDQAGGSQWKKRLMQVKRFYDVGKAALVLMLRMLAKGVRFRTALRFLWTRDPWTQLLAPTHPRLSLIPSIPYTYSQQPWIVEIEDSITLFYPYFHNGVTRDLDIRNTTVFNAFRALLESPNCRGIITHIRATADGLPKLFQSETIARKVHHITMGVSAPDVWQQHEATEQVKLLFTNSWHQSSVGFYLRGGLDVLEAFALLKPVHPHLHLVLRSQIPDDLPRRYRRIIEDCQVQVLDTFLRREELDALMRDCHAYLLPAARIHIVSLLQSMAAGLIPIVSDGWGMEEYIDDGRTGLVVRGRYGKVSWQDESTGILREDYKSMYQPDPVIIQGLVDRLSALSEDPELRRRLGHSARHEVVTRFNRTNWNKGLKEAFDQATRQS